MYKSELIEYLKESVERFGDGEVFIEISKDLNYEGKIYIIQDIVTTTSNDGNKDYLLGFE